MTGLRIAMIGPFGLRPKGTMAARALPMAGALAARGHAVTLILPPWSCPEDAGHTWEQYGVTVQNITLPRPVPLAAHAIVTARLVRQALDWRPDVIHCFKPKAYAGLAAWVVFWLRRAGRSQARLVIDTDDWEGPGGWNEVEDYSWAQRRFFAWQEPWGLTHCDAVTVASQALETLVWGLGVPREHLFYVPNGFSPMFRVAGPEPGGNSTIGQGDRLKVRRELGLGEAPVLLLYTRFVEFRPERPVAVLRQVLQQLPETRLLVVGQGLHGEEAELLCAAEMAGVRDHVVEAGWIPAETLERVFAACDVAIYPFDDTLINRAKCAVKLIDLMAAGVPVVADAVGQNVEFIQSGHSGILVPPGDVDAMAAAVLGLLRGPAVARASLGQAAARRVRETFAWERLVFEVERAYGHHV